MIICSSSNGRSIGASVTLISASTSIHNKPLIKMSNFQHFVTNFDYQTQSLQSRAVEMGF